MDEFKMANNPGQLKVSGCFILSLIYGISKIIPLNVSVTEIISKLIKENFISSDLYIYSYDKILSFFGLDFVHTKFNNVQDAILASKGKRFLLGICSTPGHCFSIKEITDHGIVIEDLGFQNDDFLNLDGFFTKNGIQQSKYKGLPRKVNSIRLFFYNA